MVVWAVCAKAFWYSPLNGLLETSLGQTATDLLLRAINVAVWLGFAAAYLRATGRDRPLSYLKLRHNAARGLVVGLVVGLADGDGPRHFRNVTQFIIGERQAVSS